MTVQEKITLVKNLYKEYNDKLKLFNDLKNQLQALSQQKLSWYSGTVDDVVANWTAIKGKLLQVKQEKARIMEVEVLPEEKPTVRVVEVPEEKPTVKVVEIPPEKGPTLVIEIVREKKEKPPVKVTAEKEPTEVIEEKREEKIEEEKPEEGIKKWLPLIILGLAALSEGAEQT